MASHRSRWEKAFRELAERALDYMEELDDDQAAELLCVRAVSILPDDTELLYALHFRNSKNIPNPLIFLQILDS